MSDGADRGMTAMQALNVIVGDGSPPDGILTRDDVRARIALAPDPCEGKDIWVRRDLGEINNDEAYSLVADAITRAFLTILLERPELLTKRHVEGQDDEEVTLLWRSRLFGAVRHHRANAMWDATLERWPAIEDWLGGPSAFQVGFAFSTVRYLYEQPYDGNPAIVDIG